MSEWSTKKVQERSLQAVWAAVTQAPGATVQALAEAAQLSKDTTHRALRELIEMGHVTDRPAVGVPRRIICGLTLGRVSTQARTVRIGNVELPIVGEIGDGPNGESVVRFYKDLAA